MQEIDPTQLGHLRGTLENKGIGKVLIQKVSVLTDTEIGQSPQPRKLARALEYGDSVIADVAGIDNFVNAVPQERQVFSTLDVASALEAAGFIPQDAEILKIGASATLLDGEQGAEVIEGQIFKNREAFLLTKAATADKKGNLKVFRLADEKRVILENQVLLIRANRENNKGVFIRIQVDSEEQDLYSLLAEAIKNAGIQHCSVRLSIHGPLKARVAVIRGIPSRSISSQAELNGELVPFEKLTTGPFHVVGSITDAASRVSPGWQRVMHDEIYARKGHHHGYSEQGDVGRHVLALYPQPSSTIEIIVEPARVIQLNRVPKKDCCPNGCPDLSNFPHVAYLRTRLRTKLLRKTKQPIAFDEADQTRVLDSTKKPKVMAECARRLTKMFADIGEAEDTAHQTAEELITDVTRTSSYEEIDVVGLEWHRKFAERGFAEPIEGLMMDRNRWVAGLIAPQLLPGSVIDHDAGDSYVARFIQNQRPDVAVHTQDAFDFRREVTELPIAFYDYGTKRLPYPEGTQFDNAILATVLHHCDEPEKMFDEVASLLRQGGRLFLFENVFTQGDHVERGVNVFFDWFFNKIFHRCGLPLPFSHFCRDQWKEFLDFKGFDLMEAREHLCHWPSIPLEHVLYVATKR